MRRCAGPGPYHHVRSSVMGSRVISDRTLSASGQLKLDVSGRARSLLDSDRTLLQRVRSGDQRVRSPREKRICALLTVHPDLFFSSSVFHPPPPSPCPSLPCRLEPRRRAFSLLRSQAAPSCLSRPPSPHRAATAIRRPHRPCTAETAAAVRTGAVAPPQPCVPPHRSSSATCTTAAVQLLLRRLCDSIAVH
jgi:hypothetical protein